MLEKNRCGATTLRGVTGLPESQPNLTCNRCGGGKVDKVGIPNKLLIGYRNYNESTYQKCVKSSNGDL